MNKPILLSALLCPLLISASDNNNKPITKGNLPIIATENNQAHPHTKTVSSEEEPAFEKIIASAASLSLSGKASSDDEASPYRTDEKHGILKQSDNVVFFMGGGPESSDEEEGNAFTAQDKGKRKMNRNALRASTFVADTDYANEDDLTSSIPHDERKGIALDERTGLPLNHPVNSDKLFN